MQRLRYAKGYFPGKRGERQFFSCLRSGINVYLSPGPTDRRTTYYSSDHGPVAGQSSYFGDGFAFSWRLVGGGSLTDP